MRIAIKPGYRNFLYCSFCVVVLFINGADVIAQVRRLPGTGLVINNDRAFDRRDEIVRISRDLLGKRAGALVPVVKRKNETLLSQLVDTDGNGRWDELWIQVNLARHRSDTLSVAWVKPRSLGSPEKTAAVLLSLKTKNTEPSPEIKATRRSRGFTQNIADPYYQMEGPGIENDKVAFRAFFDSRNGKDIYGKITAKPILEQIGVTGSWHEMQAWGMDIWKVGNSMGAGALGVYEGDVLYRLADADTSFYRALYAGPLTAAFRLSFKNWDVGTKHADGSEVMSMLKGEFFYRNKISVPLLPGQNLVAGLANFGPYPLVYTRHNAEWSSVSTYGNQAEGTNTKLGTAIMFHTDEYVAHHTTTPSDPIPNTSYVVLKPSNHQATDIYFFACWEKTDTRFSTPQGFAAYLDGSAERLAHPILTKIIQIQK